MLAVAALVYPPSHAGQPALPAEPVCSSGGHSAPKEGPLSTRPGPVLFCLIGCRGWSAAVTHLDGWSLRWTAIEERTGTGRQSSTYRSMRKILVFNIIIYYKSSPPTPHPGTIHPQSEPALFKMAHVKKRIWHKRLICINSLCRERNSLQNSLLVTIGNIDFVLV